MSDDPKHAQAAKEIAASASNAGDTDDQSRTQPILVRLLASDGLTPLEQESIAIARDTLKIARKTYWFTVFGFCAAAAAAVFVGTQVRIMADQSQMMGSQTESATAGALFDEMNTRRQLTIAQQQANAAQDSVLAVRRQMRQDQRAWVIVNLTAPPRLMPNETIFAKFTVMNVGKTPAKHMLSEFVVKKVKNGESPSFDYLPNPSLSWSSTGSMYPNEPFHLDAGRMRWINKSTNQAEPEVLTPAEYNNFRDGKFFVVLYGKIIYDDIFDVRHWIKYCAWNNASKSPSTTFTSQGCTRYNNVDNN